MHLATLRLTDIRSCDDTRVNFHPDLTVLAGENNSGKTNVLESVRLLTRPPDGRRTRYAEREDVRRGSGHDFELEARFEELSDEQRGLLITTLDGASSGNAILGLSFRGDEEAGRRGSVSLWIGPRKSPESEPEARDLIRHVHLPALRDATRELASGAPGRIEPLLKSSSNQEQQQSLVKRLGDALKPIEEDPIIETARSRIDSGLRQLTLGAQPHEARLGFTPPSLTGLARDLRFRLAQVGVEPVDLRESGLGYANLLYLASVLVELEAARESELTLFLVEEPEAHLHPQLQLLTLEFLRDQAKQSRSRTPEQAAHPGSRAEAPVSEGPGGFGLDSLDGSRRQGEAVWQCARRVTGQKENA